jgi:2'-5' RNA ligase
MKWPRVLAEVPEQISVMVQEVAALLPPADVLHKPDVIHVTVLWGLQAPEAVEKVRELLADEEPVMIRLGKTSVFPDSGDGEVLKLDIDSPALVPLNATLSQIPHWKTHSIFIPHVTIAYMRPGTAAPFAGNDALNGREFTINEVVFSDPDKQVTSIPLRGRVANYAPYQPRNAQG